MPVVHFRTEHILAGYIDTMHCPRAPRSDDACEFVWREVRVVVRPMQPEQEVSGEVSRDRIDAFRVTDISDEALHSLREWKTTRRAPSTLHSEVAEVLGEMNQAVERLVRVLLFTYPLPDMQGAQGWPRLTWSLDGQSWERGFIPMPVLYGGPGVLKCLDDESKPMIQAHLAGAVEPLFGFEHLHRARMDWNARSRWIDATIAAELGVKEFLARRNEELECLLLHLPSPPIQTLYGEVLARYDGKGSRWGNALRLGAMVRNGLIHKPSQAAPNDQAALDYLNIVAAALYELMTRLYPDDGTLAELEEVYTAAALRPRSPEVQAWFKPKK